MIHSPGSELFLVHFGGSPIEDTARPALRFRRESGKRCFQVEERSGHAKNFLIKWLAVMALVASVGGQWAILQSPAWTTMLLNLIQIQRQAARWAPGQT